MKKVICMVVTLVAILTMTGCQKDTTEPEVIGNDLTPAIQLMAKGAQPLKTYLEYHEYDGRPGFCSGVTFKGWEHN